MSAGKARTYQVNPSKMRVDHTPDNQAEVRLIFEMNSQAAHDLEGEILEGGGIVIEVLLGHVRSDKK